MKNALRVAQGGEFSNFSFAFQPIVDLKTGKACSHEALVRGPAGEPAYEVIRRYPAEQMAQFDAACRVRAIEVAARVGVDTDLNLNFLPRTSLDDAVWLRSTVDAAQQHGIALERLVAEATECDAIADVAQFAAAVSEYRRAGIKFAIDDFGAGHSGLNLLAQFQPDIVKLDMELARGIAAHGPKQAIVRAIFQVCIDLGIDFVAEGIETAEEFFWFENLGVRFVQGDLIARAAFEAMPALHIPTRG